MRKNRYPLVVVDWRDSMTWDAWHDLDEPQEPVKIKTAGYLVFKDKTYIVLAPTLRDQEGENRGGGTWTIPCGCVTKIKRLKE